MPATTKQRYLVIRATLTAPPTGGGRAGEGYQIFDEINSEHWHTEAGWNRARATTYRKKEEAARQALKLLKEGRSPTAPTGGTSKDCSVLAD